MFLICPRCLRASCEQAKKAGFSCRWCRHRWEPPDLAWSRAYYAELSELQLSLVSDGGDSFTLASLPATIGRDTEFRALQNNLAVSRAHCVLDFDCAGGTFGVRDLRSKGGTYVNDDPVPGGGASLQPGDRLRVSGVELRLEAVLRRVPFPPEPPARPGPESVGLGPSAGRLLLVPGDGGRVLASPHADGRKAVAVLHRTDPEAAWTLLALQRDAVRVNGEIIVEQVLQPFDQVILSGRSYVFDKAGGLLRPEMPGSGPALSLRGLEFHAGGRVILSGLTCRIPAGRLTAVIGRSGSGKTTLLKVLSGAALPDGGELTVDGETRPFAAYASWARNNLALVPQNDIVHGELTVRRCLEYAAALRLGSRVSAAEKTERVDKLLTDLDLAEHQNVPVSRLSGGQRKRVNVAAELVSSPPLLLLDEPTTGLDYLTEYALVAQLRKLSRQGRTIVFVTHSLATLAAADHVIFVQDAGEGGRVVVEGGPETVKERLRLDDWSDLFERPRPDRAPPLAQAAPRRRPGLLAVLTARLPLLAVLTARYVRLWTSSPLTSLASFLLLPFFLGVLVRLAVPAADGRLGSDRTLFGLIAVFWLGMNQTVREIVRERDVFLREHALRVGSLPVLLSKLTFFAGIALPQAILLSGPLKWLEVDGWSVRYSPDGLICPWPILIGMFWLGDVLGCAVGLLISSLCLFLREKGEVVAVLLVILVTLPQILFSAKILPQGLAQEPEHYRDFVLWHESAYVPELLSYFTATRYLFLPLDAIALGVPNLRKIAIFNLTVLGMFAVLVVTATWLAMESFVVVQRRRR